MLGQTFRVLRFFCAVMFHKWFLPWVPLHLFSDAKLLLEAWLRTPSLSHEKTNGTHGAWWWTPPVSPSSLLLWVFHRVDDGNTSIYGECLQIAWRGCLCNCRFAPRPRSSLWFFSSTQGEAFDYFTFTPWLRSSSGDSNYLRVTPGKGGMRGKRTEGNKWGKTDRQNLSGDWGEWCQTRRSLAITAAGTSDGFTFSAWANFHLLQRWHLFHPQKENICKSL